MGLAFLLAWRNVRRYARRSLITIITIAGGWALLLITIGISEGSYAQLVDNAARSGSGHVLIQPPDFDLFEPTSLADPEAALAAARAIPGAHANPRVHSAVFAQGDEGAAAMALGIDPVAEADTSLLASKLVEGAWLPEESGRVPRALIGRSLARRLGLSVGDRLVLTGEGNEEPLLSRVHGIFATGSTALDGNLIVVPRATAGRLAGDPDAIHQIAVVLDDFLGANAVAEQLGNEVPGAEVLTWAEAMPEIGDAVALDRVSANAMFAILFGIVGLAVLNAMLMSVMERIRELGLMLALGTRPSLLFTMVILEGLLLATVSVILGGLLGGASIAWMGREGIDLVALAGGAEVDVAGYALDALIYPRIPVGRTTFGASMVVGLTLAGVIYPAIKAARVSPVEAISHE